MNIEFALKDAQFRQLRKIYNSVKRQENKKRADVLAMLTIADGIGLYEFPYSLANKKNDAMESYRENSDGDMAGVGQIALEYVEMFLEYLKEVELPAAKKVGDASAAVDASLVESEPETLME